LTNEELALVPIYTAHGTPPFAIQKDARVMDLVIGGE
jgi:hypothetical protein